MMPIPFLAAAIKIGASRIGGSLLSRVTGGQVKTFPRLPNGSKSTVDELPGFSSSEFQSLGYDEYMREMKKRIQNNRQLWNAYVGWWGRGGNRINIREGVANSKNPLGISEWQDPISNFGSNIVSNIGNTVKKAGFDVSPLWLYAGGALAVGFIVKRFFVR